MPELSDAEVICGWMHAKPDLPPYWGCWEGPSWGGSWWVLVQIQYGGMTWAPCPLTLDHLWEVEERLDDQQWERYGDDLAFSRGRWWQACKSMVHATAAQKTAALARVLRDMTGVKA